MTVTPLIVGIGNPLRSDDGVGPAAAACLSTDPRAAGWNVVACHQLTPELAEDVARASRVVFVDALDEPLRDATSAGDGVPRVSVRSLAAPVSRPEGIGAWSHHLDPQGLLGLAAALYGTAPEATLVTVRGESFEVGEQLSEPVAAALPKVLEACLRLAEGSASA